MAPGTGAGHECDPRRRLEFEMAPLSHRVASFDDDLLRYLAGNEGRFESWLARRDVRRSA